MISKHPIIRDNILNYLNNEDYFGFTANAIIRQERLVMGAGNAKAFRDYMPNLDLAIAEEIQKLDNPYYLAIVRYLTYNIFAFQTKTHYLNKTPISLVVGSLNKLEEFANNHKHTFFHLPIPGIGYGGLTKNMVIPLLNNVNLNNLILYEYQSPPR
jgi:hypothetical protein